ncbi:hypothetical protein DICVIV_13331 [Dictyocaulus viviparus]|uniref:Uncharacterized protein n=1 Tax=Dictyocaulus viviparus TaxID=29172 RepID=A0A0D8X827_DICVI|nr:hypothetical protein DICVIV_13331 [Dictyocaulus viviparus]
MVVCCIDGVVDSAWRLESGFAFQMKTVLLSIFRLVIFSLLHLHFFNSCIINELTYEKCCCYSFRVVWLKILQHCNVVRCDQKTSDVTFLVNDV